MDRAALSPLLRSFERHLRAENRSERTVASYLVALRQAEAFLAARDVGDVARIYVSSTYGDIKDHREQVYRALRELGHDIIAMEDYVAADQRPLNKCLADAASCDLYVGVFAHRYGYAPDQDNPQGRSITELEYRHAETLGIPRLVFLLDLAVPWLPSWMDTFTGDGERGARIRALREELARERLASFFSTAEELARKVGAAVTRQLAEQATSKQT